MIREPVMEDVEKLLSYYNELMEERTFLIYTEKVTLDEEKRWLGHQLEKIRKGQLILLVAEVDDKIVGTARLERKKGRESHLAEFGIAVLKEYRSKGVGKKLFEACRQQALKLWEGKVRFIMLTVFENNEIAKNFYKKLGFKAVAAIPNAIQWNDGSLISQIVMMKEI